MVFARAAVRTSRCFLLRPSPASPLRQCDRLKIVGDGQRSRNLWTKKPLVNAHRSQPRLTFQTRWLSTRSSGNGSSVVDAEVVSSQDGGGIINDDEFTRAELSSLSGTDSTYTTMIEELNEAMERHEAIIARPDIHESDKVESLRGMAQRQWDLGRLDDAQATQEDVLRRLISLHVAKENEKDGEVPDHPDVASTLHSLGSIHARGENFAEARRWYTEALAMKQRLYGKRKFHVELGRTLNGMGILLVHEADEQDLKDDAIGGMEQAYSKAMRIFEEAEQHCRYDGLDDHDFDDDDYEKEEGSTKGDDIKDQLVSEGDSIRHQADLINILGNQAMLFRANNEHDVALGKYQKILAIRRLEADDDDESVMEVRLNIADCLASIDRLDDAAKDYEEILSLHLKKCQAEMEKEGDGDRQVGRDDETPWDGTSLESVIRHNLGRIHAQEGRFEMALGEYERSHSIKKRLAGESHPEVASTLNCMGAVHGTMGDKARALAFFREALFIYRLNSGELLDDHPDVVNTLQNIAMVEGARLRSPDDDRLE